MLKVLEALFVVLAAYLFHLLQLKLHQFVLLFQLLYDVCTMSNLLQLLVLLFQNYEFLMDIYILTTFPSEAENLSETLEFLLELLNQGIVRGINLIRLDKCHDLLSSIGKFHS